MKRWKTAVGVALATWVIVGSVQADDGQVPDATLRALGLGGMTKASDADGLQVRAKGFEVTVTILRAVYETVTVDRRTLSIHPVEEQITIAAGGREFTLTVVRAVIEQRVFRQNMTVVRLVPVTITIPRGGAGAGVGTVTVNLP